MTKDPTPTEKSKKQHDNKKNATKTFDYTTTADRLRTVSWGNDSNLTGVVKPVYGIPTFPRTTKPCNQKGIQCTMSTVPFCQSCPTSVCCCVCDKRARSSAKSRSSTCSTGVHYIPTTILCSLLWKSSLASLWLTERKG